MYRQLLVPVDPRPACEAAVRRAYRLTRHMGGRVTLLYVLEAGQEQTRRLAEERLVALASGARVPPECRLVEAAPGQGHDRLAAEVGACGPDLVLIGVDGSEDPAALGTLVTRLSLEVGVPVKAVPARARASVPRAARWLPDAAATG